MNDSVFSLKRCYAVAWKAFGKWWIPLCLISGLVMVFEIGPRILLRPETRAFESAVADHLAVLKTGSLEQIADMLVALQVEMQVYMLKLSRWLLLAFPFVALLTMILLMWANSAVKDRRGKNSFGRLVYIALLHVGLALIKGIAFLFFILPGVFIYIRLLFVSLILLEEKETGVVEAVKRSWALTAKNFWELLALVALNSVLQFAVAPTLIGLIPVTGFVNTARAAAYQMLKKHSVPAVPPPL